MSSRFEEVELTNMCMVKSHTNCYLVIDRRDSSWPGLVFPGGHIERNESITDSVIREVKEETGIIVNSPKLCGIKEFTNHEGRRYIVFLYKAENYEGTLLSSQEGIAKWLSIEEINKGQTVSGFYDMLQVFENDSISEVYYPPHRASNEMILM